jgi:pyruvate dehydrogenase E2 component (dihydrolipoamide acetyltransferase)
VVPQQQITLTATIDHRFIDGFQGGTIARVVRSIFEDPWQLDRVQAAFATLVDRDGGEPRSLSESAGE